MRGKLIVIEGTDCSGKETQTNRLLEGLREIGISVEKYAYPAYDTPTGKIVGGPYLGKSYICEGWFPETAAAVDPKVASLYYAADRRYNRNIIEEYLNNGINVILDRYTYSSMAHQGGKIKDAKERNEMFDWIETLEFDLLELPHADIKIFLHMPLKYSLELGKNRTGEALDQHESNPEHLANAEKAYLEVASRYNFKTIECATDEIKSKDDISKEVFEYVKKELNGYQKSKLSEK